MENVFLCAVCFYLFFSITDRGTCSHEPHRHLECGPYNKAVNFSILDICGSTVCVLEVAVHLGIDIKDLTEKNLRLVFFIQKS